MKFALRLCCALLIVSTFASLARAQPDGSTTVSLWNGLPPGTTLTGEGYDPKLIITQAESKTPTAGVVILPGGGYGGHAIDHEGYQFADWFRSMGVTSAICTYRLRGKGNDGKGYGHPAPMIDAQHAIQTMRAQAKELNLDPNRIGVIGFSAGGHLCSTVSTHFNAGDPASDDPIARVSSRPNFSILCYPVVGLGKPYTHKGSQRNLLGSDPDPELVKSLSNEGQVTKETPPTFLFHTGKDTAVPVDNSIEYYMACLKHDVPVELHVFPEGKHGLGLAQKQPGAAQWPKLCENWLRQLGVVTIE